MKSVFKKVKKYGAQQYIKQAMDNHIFFYTSILALLLGFSKKSLEILRLCISNRILKKLRKRYKKFIIQHTHDYNNDKSREISNKVWVCWLQGYDQAPDIVKKCILSQQKYLKNKEYILLTEENYSQYIQFPDFVNDKIKRGIISKTHMSDLLRLELLKNYGGTWIDATVFVSGRVPSYMTDSQLFVFQDLKPGLDGHCTAMSSWFITAQKKEPIISLTLDLLYEYWSHNDKLIDYFIIHDFFQLATEAYPDEWNGVVPVSNSTPHILLLRLFDKYNPNIWTAIKEQTSINKLSYKFNQEKFAEPDTYFDIVVNQEGNH